MNRTIDKHYSAWPGIRWIGAAVVYILTLMIAWDIIGARNEEIAQQKLKIEKMREGMKDVMATLDQLSASSDDQLETAMQMKQLLEVAAEEEKQRVLNDMQALQNQLGQ